MPYVSPLEKDFFQKVCRWADSSDIAAARKWWNAFHEVIVRELFFHATVKVPELGTFKTKHIAKTIQKQRHNGKIIEYEVPAHDIVSFEPHDTFTNDVNMQGVTKAYRGRMKQGTISQNDLLREARAECEKKCKADPKNRAKYEAEFRRVLLAKARKSPGKRSE